MLLFGVVFNTPQATRWHLQAGLDEGQQARVDADNYSSDYLLALQHWGHQQNLACLRENPLRSLHWWDPVEQYLCREDDW